MQCSLSIENGDPSCVSVGLHFSRDEKPMIAWILGYLAINWKNMMNCKRIGVEQFRNIQGSMHVVHTIYGISRLSCSLHLAKHRFYMT